MRPRKTFLSLIWCINKLPCLAPVCSPTLHLHLLDPMLILPALLFIPPPHGCHAAMLPCCYTAILHCTTARELDSLGAIMHLCDCVFTPITEADDPAQLPCRQRVRPLHPVLDMRVTGQYSAYCAPEWVDPQEGYLHRSWCRLELYYGEG